MNYVEFCEVAEIARTVATEEECKTLPYVGLEHIEKETGRFAPEFARAPEMLLSSKFKFTPRHVLYGKLRPYLNKVVRPTFDGVCSTDILPILPDETQLDRTYLWAIFLSPKFVAWASVNVSGANLPRLDPKQLEKYTIPLPPLPEQRRIAALLDKVGRLRRTRRYAAQLSDTFLQSVFVWMFGEPVKNPMGWDKTELGEIAAKQKFAIVDGPFGSDLKAEEYTDSGVRVIRVNNIKPNAFNFTDVRFVSAEKYETIKRSTVRPNDIIMAKVGNTIGKTCVFPSSIEHAVLTANVCKITVDPECADSIFISRQMNFEGIQEGIRNLSGDTAKPMINIPRLSELKLIVPPLAFQQKFAHIVQQFEHLCAQQREAERQAEHLFQTLLHRAFSGEL